MREGWKFEKLESVIDQFIVPQRDRPKIFDGVIPWCRIEDIDGIYLSESKSGLCVSQEVIDSMPLRVYPIGTVIVSCSADLGRCAIISKPLVTNQTFIGLVPSEKIDSHFLYYLMGHYAVLLNSMASGATIKYLSKKKFQNIEIPIPTLQEQKQIVAIINRAFKSIDQAKANIEKNIKNAKELIITSKKKIYEEIEKSFPTVKLPSVCNEIFAGGDAPKENLSKEITEEYNIPVIANAVKDNGLYGYTDKARVTEPAVTIAARGSGTGHTEIRKEAFFPIVRLIVLIPDLEQINLEFLKFSMESLTILKSGSAIPQLTVPMIKSYSFPLPDLEKQKNIVAHIIKLEKEVEEINSINLKRLANVEELKKSILQKGFAGDLTQKEVEVKLN